MEPRPLYGRKQIFTDAAEITRENIFEVLGKAWATHLNNRGDIEYLWKYYKGEQPVLLRVKDVRPEILNKIVVNRANQIVEFKSGYLIGEPVQYVARSDADEVSDSINALNEYMFEEDKHEVDKELIDWLHICGTSYRFVLPENSENEEEAPFHIYSLDPRNTFVVYYNGVGQRPVMGVTYAIHSDNSIRFSIYTETRYYEIEYASQLDVGLAVPPLDGILVDEGHICGDIPIVEYPANKARLGAFEIVITLLDALNDTESDRLDGIDQIIQALLVLEGVDLENEKFAALKAEGGLCIPEGSKAYYLCQELNQSQTQITIDNIYQEILEICGLPNRNGGSSTSDTGSAVIMRDGWSDAEARAKSTEEIFKRSEKRFLRIVLRCMSLIKGIDLRVSNIDIRFTRRNYDNIQSKSQVLTTMLANDKIHPRLAFEHCGMFVDAELAYKESMEYYEAAQKKAVSELKAYTDSQTALAQREAEDAEIEEEKV